KTIYSSRQALAAAVPGEIKIEAPSTDKDADAVVHPGALTYLNDSQQSFFDKYGDEIFYGMLIFPVFGSALAGMASYLRRDTRTRRLRLLQRVLDLVRKAHGTQNLEALEQLQVEADNLVIAIVHQGEREEFDETVRMSFAFALDQLRFAIAARRTAVLDHSGTAHAATTAAAATMQTPSHGQSNRQWWQWSADRNTPGAPSHSTVPASFRCLRRPSTIPTAKNPPLKKIFGETGMRIHAYYSPNQNQVPVLSKAWGWGTTTFMALERRPRFRTYRCLTRRRRKGV